MDPELMSLASTAGATLVALMTTDAWKRAKGAVIDVWRRHRPGAVTNLEADLDEVRAEVLATKNHPAEDAAVASWENRIAMHMLKLSQTPASLSSLVGELNSILLSEQSRTPGIYIDVSTSGSGRTNVLGQGQQFNLNS
jgi:hypothetical protein